MEKADFVKKYAADMAALGKYYYVWDSPKFKYPLLLMTDYCMTGEDAELFGYGSAYGCKVYYVDSGNSKEIIELGEIGPTSTYYPLATSDKGIFSANSHYVIQYVPDYESKEIKPVFGFEDNILDVVCEHDGYLNIVDGQMQEVDETESCEREAYEAYYGADRLEFSEVEAD